ncbi:MAG: hypothetical protein WAK17_30205 [Candidatus Nitrosopolaris sp.]
MDRRVPMVPIGTTANPMIITLIILTILPIGSTMHAGIGSQLVCLLSSTCPMGMTAELSGHIILGGSGSGEITSTLLTIVFAIGRVNLKV